jgi:hypothetical protein
VFDGERIVRGQIRFRKQGDGWDSVCRGRRGWIPSRLRLRSLGWSLLSVCAVSCPGLRVASFRIDQDRMQRSWLQAQAGNLILAWTDFEAAKRVLEVYLHLQRSLALVCNFASDQLLMAVRRTYHPEHGEARQERNCQLAEHSHFRPHDPEETWDPRCHRMRRGLPGGGLGQQRDFVAEDMQDLAVPRGLAVVRRQRDCKSAAQDRGPAV